MNQTTWWSMYLHLTKVACGRRNPYLHGVSGRPQHSSNQCSSNSTSLRADALAGAADTTPRGLPGADGGGAAPSRAGPARITPPFGVAQHLAREQEGLAGHEHSRHQGAADPERGIGPAPERGSSAQTPLGARYADLRPQIELAIYRVRASKQRCYRERDAQRTDDIFDAWRNWDHGLAWRITRDMAGTGVGPRKRNIRHPSSSRRSKLAW